MLEWSNYVLDANRLVLPVRIGPLVVAICVSIYVLRVYFCGARDVYLHISGGVPLTILPE